MAKAKKHTKGVRPDVAQALDREFPDGVVRMPEDLQDTWFRDVCPRLKEELAQIDGAAIYFEREPEGGLPYTPKPQEDIAQEEEPAVFGELAADDWEEPPSSYHLFFVGLTDEELTYISEDQDLDENGSMIGWIKGTGRIGCAVGVSLIAPFAAITLHVFEEYENGSQTYPDLEFPIFEMDGTRRDPDDHVREMFFDEGVETLHALRDRIIEILASLNIEVLPDDVLETPLPHLRADESTNIELQHPDEPLTVEDAFFFRGP